MQPIREIGDFRAEIYAYEPKESQKAGSESMAFAMKCILTHKLDPQTQQFVKLEGTWVAEGEIYYLKADGSEDLLKIESLMQATGWDGKAESLMGVDPTTFAPLPDDKRWKPLPIIVTIKEDDYLVKTGKGGVRYRIDRIRPEGSVRTQVPESAARRIAEKMAKAKAKTLGGQPVAEDGGGIPF